MYSDAEMTTTEYVAMPTRADGKSYPDILYCNWPSLKVQLLEQWPLVTDYDLQAVGPYRSKIAALIGKKYGIAPNLIEHYLRNFERTIYARLCLMHGSKLSEELEQIEQESSVRRFAQRRASERSGKTTVSPAQW